MKRLVPARALAVAVVAVLLAGCSFVNPILTQKNYAPSDGARFVAGDLEALNLILVAEDEQGPATLVGTLHHRGSEPLEVSVTIDDGDPVVVTVPANGSVRISPFDDDTEISGIASVAPGLLAPIQVQWEGTGTRTVQVPVMDGTLSQYRATVEAIG